MPPDTGSQFTPEVWICTIQYGIVAKSGNSGSSSPPPSVDPVALANAQTQSNIASATNQSLLNNVNTESPLGSSLFSFDPATGRWGLNQSLNPQTQALLNAQLGASTGQATALSPLIAQAQQFGQSGAGLLGMNAAPTSNGSSLPGYYSGQPTVNLQNSINLQSELPNLQKSVNLKSELPTLQNSVNLQGSLDLQHSLDTNFGPQVQKAQDAAYGAQAQYLDPQFYQARSDLAQRLADQGISQNNAAYTRATGDLSRQQQQAYQGAQDAAVAAGNQEQATLFGEGNIAGQFANQATALGGAFANQSALQGGQFANQAAQEGGDFWNNATLAEGQFNNQAAQQGGQFWNNAALAGGQFANQAALQGGQFLNQEQQQSFGQQQQLWQNPLTYFGALNGAANQNFGSSLSGISGAQPNFAWAGNLPTFGGSPTSVSPTNVVGAQQVANLAAQNRFADSNQLNNQMFNGLGSLGSTLGVTGSGGLLSGVGPAIGSAFSSGPSFAALNAGLDASQLALAPTIAGSAEGLGALATAAPAAWIICTELMRQGRLPKRHWVAGASVFSAYPERGKRGYYIWAIPTVRHLRRHPDSMYSKIIGAVFRWRAENIAGHKGVKGARKLWRGAAVTAVLYPMCKIIGAFLPPIDWQSVYLEGDEYANR